MLVVALFVAACGSTPPPSVSPSPEVIEFSGNNDVNTAPFTLTGDTYVSAWTKEPGCTFAARLKSPTDEFVGWDLGGSYSDGPTSGETWAYNVEGGSFYLRVQGSCSWTLTLRAG